MSQKKRLTKAAVGGIEPPATGRATVYDTAAPGLQITVTASGARSWYWVGRIAGRREKTRLKLGSFPAVVPDQARKRALEAATKAAAGEDPRPAKKQRQAADMTLAEAYARFKREPSPQTRKPRRASTLRSYDILVQEGRDGVDKRTSRQPGPLEPFRDRKLSQITRKDVQAFAESYGAKHPYQCNRSLALLSAIYNTATRRWGYEGLNPAHGVERHAEESRIRFLRRDELRRFLDALDTEPDRTAADSILTALWTGARRANVFAMRWAHIDTDAKLWHVPADEAKTGENYTVTLSREAMEILERRQGCDPTYVFPSRRKPGEPITEVRGTFESALRKAGIEGFRFHDLRHSLASHMSAAGVNLQTIAAQLGHRQISTTQKYSHLDTASVAAAVSSTTAAMKGDR